MSNQEKAKKWNTGLSAILRFLLVFYIAAVVFNFNIPFVSSGKTAFIVLTAIGVAVSMASNWRFIIGVDFKDPVNIIGSVFGLAAVVLIIFAHKEIPLLFIQGYTSAFYVLAILLLIKVGLKIWQDRPKKETGIP